MNPLDEESRRFIEEATGADVPPAGLEERVWQRVSAGRNAPLSPIAEAAAKRLPGRAVWSLASGGAKLGLVAAASLVGVVAYLALGPVSTGPAGTRPVASSPRPAAAPAEDTASAGDTAPQLARSTLGEETALVAAAQQALAQEDPERARRSLVAHRERFPAGALAQERDAAWIVMLCMRGRVEEAAQARRAFETRWPTSPLGPRVQQACQ